MLDCVRINTESCRYEHNGRSSWDSFGLKQSRNRACMYAEPSSKLTGRQPRLLFYVVQIA